MDSRAGQRLPKGPLWPFTGCPHEVQHGGRRATGVEVEGVATEAVAGRGDITGTVTSGDITVAVARENAAETTAGLEATEAAAILLAPSEAEAAGVVATEAVAWVGVLVEVVVGEKEVEGHTLELVDTAAPGSLAEEEEEEVAGATAACRVAR